MKKLTIFNETTSREFLIPDEYNEIFHPEVSRLCTSDDRSIADIPTGFVFVIEDSTCEKIAQVENEMDEAKKFTDMWISKIPLLLSEDYKEGFKDGVRRYIKSLAKANKD